MKITIFTQEQSWSLLHAAGFEGNPAKPTDIKTVFTLLQSGKMAGNLLFRFPTNELLKETWQAVNKHFLYLEAAGGIIRRPDNRLLFISRFRKWDLPKGKIEKRETPQDAARREIKEECNIGAEIHEKIGDTYHTYPLKGKNVMKRTHWFSMRCTEAEAQNAAPQTEEGITGIHWFSAQELESTVFPNTYRSIKEIYQKFTL